MKIQVIIFFVLFTVLKTNGQEVTFNKMLPISKVKYYGLMHHKPSNKYGKYRTKLGRYVRPYNINLDTIRIKILLQITDNQ